MDISSTNLDDSLIETFQREGAVVLRGLFSEWVEPLREGVDTLIEAPSPLERSYQPYYCVESTQCISFWIPLDAVACETSLKCIAGSHRWNKLHRPKRFDGSDLYQGDTREELPDIDANHSQYRIRQWALSPGDAVAFDFRTVHGASANTSLQRRRVFSARWLGDNARFVDRGGKGSPPFAHLTLQNGDALTGSEFPIVYRLP